MSSAQPQSQPDREWISILALTIVATLLRLAGFGRLGLDHFDEGIYASAGTWSLSPGGLGGMDPGLIPYAPPGYPILVGLPYWLFAPMDRAAIAVSIVAGIAAVPLAGWLGRRTFGRGAGTAAAGFAAGSMAHVTFSRMALTDATFLLAWLAVMVAGGRFLEKPGPWRAVALGLAVGIAQLVKYNGWLAGAIVAATAVLGSVVSAEERTQVSLGRTFGWGMLAAVVAALVDWPWFRFVEAHGGYAALLTHQRGYFDGPRSWPSNWLLQLRQLAALGPAGNLATILGPILGLLGLLAMALLAKRRARGAIIPFLSMAVLSLILYRASTTWWLGLGLAFFLIGDKSPTARLVGVWWVALSILTPMYHPYARLWLPVEASGWVGGGMVLATAFRWAVAEGAGPSRRDRAKVVAVVLAVLVGWAVPGLIPPRPKALPGGLAEPRDSLRSATSRIVAHIPEEVRTVRVLGRPAMLFYTTPVLGWRGIAGGRLPDSAALLAPGAEGWAIVDAVLLRQEGDPRAVLDRLRERWEVVAEVPTTLSKATLLDVDPRAATGDLTARDEPLILLRPRAP
jgi:4-amino-4-deoxy-L-arabinose transferase-like glycosyltransferase